ncbi:unnamed protein product [marine sediment metagenome]|uniref:Uncharacterized protein n=1 Tax=marine sediment metagenome TaxID=412755 RepID=X1AVG8_9ZZZZ
MILEKKESGMIEIDLTGPDGNVFNLLAQAKKLTSLLNDRRENEYLLWDDVKKDMMSADYDHAVDVFEEHFGHIVILYK